MHRIGYLLTDGFQMLALGTQSVFEFANAVLEQPYYVVEQYAMQAGGVRSSMGVTVSCKAIGEAERLDTLVVLGVTDPLGNPTPAELVDFLRHAAIWRRVAGICTGAFPLAEAGQIGRASCRERVF